MTQEPEYICTEEDLSCLSDYIEAALMGDESKIRLRELFDQEFSVIRSRPHLISPLTQDTTKPDSMGKYAIEPWERDAIIKQIRKDEREKVYQKLDTGDILHDLYYVLGRVERAMKDNHCIVSEIDVIVPKIKHAIKIIKSLRKKDGE